MIFIKKNYMTEESRTTTSIILTDDDRTPQISIDPHLLIPEGVYRLETSNTLVSSTRQRRQVRWTEDTIDNEHLNHRKSNGNTIKGYFALNLCSLLHFPPRQQQ